MVHAGFRLGEALAMRLRHLDLTKMSYHISESYKQHRFSSPKQGKKRFVDLPNFLTEELNQYIMNLRHTYASILLMANKSPAYVKEQLGHSSIAITVDIYGHWIPGKGREGLDEALLGGVPKLHISAYKEKRSQ
jgi:integrase